MGLPRFIKLPEYNRFTYIPRYYDERKEERASRNRKIKEELGIKDENKYVPQIKGEFRKHYIRKHRAKNQSNVRLIVILIVLSLVAYYLFYY